MPDSEPVRLWRERFKLNLSASWKADVERTVTDLDLWKEILDGWHYFKDGKKFTKHPGIKGLLDEYERQFFNRNGSGDAQAASGKRGEAVSTRGGTRLPEGRDRYVPQMPSEAECFYFGID